MRLFPGLMLLSWLFACGNYKAFDADLWQHGNPRVRGTMAEDLVHKPTLIGKSVADVEKLLGCPARNYPNLYLYKIDLGLPLKDPARASFQGYFKLDTNVREAKIGD